MAADTDVPARTGSVFPADIEHLINDVVLADQRHMNKTMSLVAWRFYEWTKPTIFRTIVVRRSNDWTTRIADVLPYASLIRVLTIVMPWGSAQLSREELRQIRLLLDMAKGVRHLAVVWTVWAEFSRECGSLPLKSLYLLSDGSRTIPSLENLQYPSLLRDLTVYAPGDYQHHMDTRVFWRNEGHLYFPATCHCGNLAYVTYAASWEPVLTTIARRYDDVPRIKGVMFVLVDIPQAYLEDHAAADGPRTKEDLESYSDFSTAYLRFSSQVLDEWLKKMEGKRSVLEHPPPHPVGTADGRFGIVLRE